VSIYREYASVYDRSGQLAFSERMIPYLASVLERHPTRHGAMLDLACGTGTVAIALALQGWQVIGVDQSADMLHEARIKQEALGSALAPSAIRWQQADMRTFALDQRVSLATCLYDSLNYMLCEADLAAVFAHVSGALDPGGLFLCDMNTAYALENYWDEGAWVTDNPDMTVIMASSHDYERHRSTVQVTCFERVDALYRKIQETHVEQAYPVEHISTLMRDAGLQVEAVYRCFTLNRPDEVTPRAFWVARKPGLPGAAS
jgi:SAM-dependent methyltransferase